MAKTQAKRKPGRIGALVPAARIEKSILLVRGEKVLLDSDLASLYGVATKVLNQAVKRNLDRFPPDFMFPLTRAEKARVVTDCDHLAHLKFSPTLPRAFTEEGVAMLSAVLRSPTAIAVSIEIIRVFVNLRRLLSSHGELREKFGVLERKLAEQDKHFGVVFDAIRQLMADEEAPSKPPIGFETETKTKR